MQENTKRVLGFLLLGFAILILLVGGCFVVVLWSLESSHAAPLIPA